MCRTCTFAIQCYAVADTNDKRQKTIAAYEQHLKLAHRLSDKVIAEQLENIKLIGKPLVKA
jgi:hypothetical protein